MVYERIRLNITLMILKKDNAISEEFLNQISHYSIRVGERFYKRLSKHIQLLKKLKSIKNKQRWIEETLLMRLKKEEELDLEECIPSEKYLSFKINSQIDAKIEQRVEIIKRVRGSFSKKQWVVEAICDRLDIEEKITKEKAQELFKNMLKETSEIIQMNENPN